MKFDASRQAASHNAAAGQPTPQTDEQTNPAHHTFAFSNLSTPTDSPSTTTPTPQATPQTDAYSEPIDVASIEPSPALQTETKLTSANPLPPTERGNGATPPESQTNDEAPVIVQTPDTDTQISNLKSNSPNTHHFAVDRELDKHLVSLHDTEEETLAKRLAEVWNMGYVNLEATPIETDALALIPEREAVSSRTAAFKLNNKSLDVAIENPTSVESQAAIKRLGREGYIVTAHIASKKSVARAIARYGDLRLTSKTHGGMIDVSSESIANIASRVHANSDVQAVISELMKKPHEQGVTSELIETIMGSSIATGSSDVHIEPQENFVRLRLRQDGVLQDVYELPHDVAHSLTNRIKILSGMKLTIVKDAQDGRFTVTYDKTEIEIRVSTIPGPYGEGIVMRILDPRGLTVSFEKMGVDAKLLAVFREQIAKPEGIILTTGPTGSGKTTTLYTFLKTIYTPEIKIITIEDPIEYHLAGIEQTQVDAAKGYDFMSGLRAAMRQDPEVVMVGEIRDQETAITAIQAAQTGHLVLSTLHTNSAAAVIPRLVVLGVNPSLLASTLRMAIAQRLVRTLIAESRAPRPATTEETLVIRKILQNAEKHGKNIATRFGFTGNDATYTLYDPVPTDAYPTGFHGRVGLFEAIIMDNEVRRVLEGTPTERSVREAAHHQGLLTMAEDAIVKILQGTTCLSEVSEVIDLAGDIDDDITGELQDQPEIMSPLSWTGEGQGEVDETTAKAGILHHSKGTTASLPSFSADPSQLETLWMYMKQLQNEQAIFPDESRAAKLSETEDILMDMMKRNHGITDIPSEDAIAARITNEATNITAELENLKAHASEHPDPATADKLHQLHALLQDLNN